MNKNIKFFMFGLLAVLVLSLAACGGSAPAADEAPAADAPAAEAPAADATAAPAGSGAVVPAFKFTNNYTGPLCNLYLSPVSTDNWGPDQLNGQQIAPGESYILKNIPEGTYDAKATFCDGNEQTLQLDIKN